MMQGLGGSLLSHEILERLAAGLDGLELPSEGMAETRRALRRWHAGVRPRLGPACSPRHVFDLVADPLLRTLGFTVVTAGGTADRVDALLRAHGTNLAALVVPAWDQGAGSTWRQAVHLAIAHDVRWCMSLSGPALRIFDSARAWARRYAEFDLALAIEDERTFAVLYGLLRPSALRADTAGSTLDRVIALCERHRVAVRASLRDGVHQAVVRLIGAFRAASKRHSDTQLLHESLTIVYRLLFLLFAEARSLVPHWHPIYRDGYTLDGLCGHLRPGVPAPGLWEGLQAIARLAHQGCRAGTLRVTPFNGRLFSPSHAPLADSVALDDRAVGDVLVSLTTRAGAAGRERISYADLGVEQLGGVYEHLLDFDVRTSGTGGAATLVPTGRRKATGSFYTPRSLTDFIVRRTLAPLVKDASATRILELRVLDPAMGSGAFLVAACRYLAGAYEQALIRDGSVSPAEVDAADRAEFRRAIAQRCLFGVDVNPTAVQLARLSLWLATLAADKPLTFLDHHLRPGNSLVGATAEAMLRCPVPGRRRARERELPLFAGEELHGPIQSAVAARSALAGTPDHSLEQVRRKEKTLASLEGPDGPVARWKAAADVWCAAWYASADETTTPAVLRAALDGILGHAGVLPGHVTASILSRARGIAAAHRFFHWPFEFPEVFHDEGGVPLPHGGFDAVVGNPPWEMLRGDRGADDAADLQRFVRHSGIYRLQGGGHGNLYQLFLERTFHLLRPGGRCGVILPAGLATDRACAPLRRQLLGRTSVDTFTTVENREGIFPIHRGLKFLLVTFAHGGTTAAVPARAGVRAMDALDSTPDAGPPPGCVAVPRPLLERLSGPDLAIPELRGEHDLAICSAIAFRVPALDDPGGWRISFGRELNATDDKPHFTTGAAGLPVIEGKQLQPFRVEVDASRYRIPPRTAARLLDADGTFMRARLAYRDVASPTNRMTLIAAIVPAGVVTTHTVFCLKQALEPAAQHYLCGVFNSYVANYLVRMRVGTHVAAGLVARLPVPRPDRTDPRYCEVGALSRMLAGSRDAAALARLNAVVASLYALSSEQFRHVLETFPLVAASEREMALRTFSELSGDPPS